MTQDRVVEIVDAALDESIRQQAEATGEFCVRVLRQAVLSALSSQGLAVVPVEPSIAMLRAAQDAWINDPGKRSSTLYRAMLSASQEGRDAR